MTLILDGAAVAEMLRSPAGPVGRHLMTRATLFQNAARAQLAPHRKSGCLEDTIVKRFEELGGELVIRVISDTSPCSPTRESYSLMVHDGTEPHPILPRQAGGVLAFPWPAGPTGGMFFTRSVEHPGTAPIPFFADNLPLIVA